MMKLTDRLDKPTKIDLIVAFESLSDFDAIIVYIVTKLNYNLFIFIAGIFASLSINLLTSFVGLKLGDIFYFTILTCTVTSSILLTYNFISFTIRYIELRDITSREPNLEKYINKSFETCNLSLPYLRRKFKLSIAFSVLTVITMISCFIRSNFEFNL